MLSSVFSRKHSRLFVFRGHLIHERAHVILAQKNIRIEELSATVARLESALGQAGVCVRHGRAEITLRPYRVTV